MSNQLETWHQFDDRHYRNRWVAYIDLIGFCNAIKEKHCFDVFCTLADSRDAFSREVDSGIGLVWFSDTILLYSNDDSRASFVDTHTSLKWALRRLISKMIPFRGALAHGRFYADKGSAIYFGPSLIEAYRYGENQDWLGFILAPSSEKRMQEIDLPAGKRLDYAIWNVPFKPNFDEAREQSFAFLFAGGVESSTRDWYMDQLRSMRSQVDHHESGIRAKYDRAIEFLEKNKRFILPPPPATPPCTGSSDGPSRG